MAGDSRCHGVPRGSLSVRPPPSSLRPLRLCPFLSTGMVYLSVCQNDPRPTPKRSSPPYPSAVIPADCTDQARCHNVIKGGSY